MSELSNFTADVVRGLGAIAGKFTAIDKALAGGLLGKALTTNFKYSLLGQLAQLGDSTQPRPTARRSFMGGSGGTSSVDLVEKKRQADLKKLSDAQVKAQKALTAEQKKQNALKKAGTIFDLEQIQIIAALQGNLSKDEETRLKAQLALLNGNAAVATSLTKQILMSQDATGNLYKLWQSLPDAKNPFAYLEGYLDMLAGKAAALFANQNAVVAVAPPVTGAGGSQFGPGPYLFPSTNVAPMPAPSYNSAAAANRYSDSTGPIQVSVNIDGKQIASSLQDSSMSGIPSSVNRTYGSFAGR
jgi:hypothetical protein